MALERRDTQLGQPSASVVRLADLPTARQQERVQPREGALSVERKPTIYGGFLSYASNYERRIREQANTTGALGRMWAYYTFEPDEAGTTAGPGRDTIRGANLSTNNGGPGSAVAGLPAGEGNAYQTHATLGSSWTYPFSTFGLPNPGGIGLWFKTAAIGARQIILDMGASGAAGGGQIAITAAGAITWAGLSTPDGIIKPGVPYFLIYNYGFGASVSINNHINLLNYGAGNVPAPQGGNGTPIYVELGNVPGVSTDPFIGTYDEFQIDTFLMTESDYVYGASLGDNIKAYSYMILPAEADTALGGVVTTQVLGTLATEADTAINGTVVKTVAGTLATEADTAINGTASVASGPQTIAGTVALEADSALAGAALKTVAGTVATEADSALTGAPTKQVAGGLATEADSALAGTPRKTVAGGIALEADTAINGTAVKPIFIAGTVALEADSALAGVARKAVLGQVATEADSALAGAARKTVAGTLATEADSALVGAPRKTVTGTMALETDMAIPGTANQPQVITGAVAIETDTAISGTVRKTVGGTLAVEGDTVPTGAARKTVAGTFGIEFDSTIDGTVIGGLGAPTIVGPTTLTLADYGATMDIYDPALSADIADPGGTAELEDPMAGATAAILDYVTTADLYDPALSADIEDPGNEGELG
jgi:hypothetical protein